MKVVAVDWFREFKSIPDSGFVRVIEEVLREARYFPVMADLWNASKKTGLCERCKYRNLCTPKKKYDKDFGETCDSCIPGPAER